MRFLKSYNELLKVYMSTDILDIGESLSIDRNVLISSIGGEEVDIIDTLNLPVEFRSKMDISLLSSNVEFINSLTSLGLKKSSVQNSSDYETFIKPFKFLLIHDHNSNELENPQYILFQTWNDWLKEWETAQLYKLKSGIGGFYDKLSSKTVEIIDGDSNYIYSTSNGNDWDLQNSDKVNDTYKKSLRRDDFQKLINDKKGDIKLNII